MDPLLKTLREAERMPDPASISPNLQYTLTPQGRAALGRRKPLASDFVPRNGVTPKATSAPLDFKP